MEAPFGQSRGDRQRLVHVSNQHRPHEKSKGVPGRGRAADHHRLQDLVGRDRQGERAGELDLRRDGVAQAAVEVAAGRRGDDQVSGRNGRVGGRKFPPHSQRQSGSRGHLLLHREQRSAADKEQEHLSQSPL